MGLGAAAAGAIGLEAGSLGALAVGGVVDAGIGAGLGAGEAAITGGDPGKGALGGAISGGILGGFGPELGTLTGSAVAGDALAGAAGGALGGAATGSNPLTGAIVGGIGGAATGEFASSSGTSADSFGGGVAPTGAVGDLTSTAGSLEPQAAGLFGDSSGGTVALTGAGPVGASPNAPTLSADNVLSQLNGIDNAGGTSPQEAGLFGNSGAVPTTGFPPATAGGPTITNANSTAPQAMQLLGGNTSAGQSGGNFFDKALTSVENQVTQNPIPTALAGGGLLMTLLNGQGAAGKNLSALQSEASGLNAQGQQLASYLQTGQLPPGVQTSINQATASAKAAVKSNFAARGLSGSTMEQQALQQIDLNAVGQTTQIANTLLTTGINEQNIAAGLLEGVLNANVAQAKNTGQSITGLAAALSGGNRTQQAA